MSVGAIANQPGSSEPVESQYPLHVTPVGVDSAWTVTHAPAANTKATASKAAAGAGVKNVCTAILVTCSAGATAPTAVQLNVSLRDGATGAGTIKWSAVLGIPATAGASTGFALPNLWIVGTANTAMTLEFEAAGGANTIEAVAMSGRTIS